MNEVELATDAIHKISNGVDDKGAYSIILSTIIVVVFLASQKVLDYYKRKNEITITDNITKTMSEILISINDVSAAMVKLTGFFTKITETMISKDKEKCRMAIKLSFASFEKAIFDYGKDIIINNHIEQKREYIISNVEHIVNSEYYKLFGSLSLYEVDGVRVSSSMKECWKSEVSQFVISIIFNPKLDSITRLNVLHGKLSVRIADFATYVYNKNFNE